MTPQERKVMELAREALTSDGWKKAGDAIRAIDEALAQPEQEPVAFVKGCNRGQWEIFPAKAYQIFEREQPLYTTPPQRTWVGLTDEEIALVCSECAASAHNWNDISFARAIEAKLKEKNT